MGKHVTKLLWTSRRRYHVERELSQRVVQRGTKVVPRIWYGGVFQSPRRDPQRRNGWAHGFRALLCTGKSRMMGKGRQRKTLIIFIVCAYVVTEDLELPDIRGQERPGSAETRGGSFLASGLGSPRAREYFNFFEETRCCCLRVWPGRPEVVQVFSSGTRREPGD